MYTVALLAQKGGVGKSTLVRALAVQAHLARMKGGIVDADPQATTSGWHLRRQERAVAATRPTPVTDAEVEAIRRAVQPRVSAAPNPVLLSQAVDDARDDGFAWLFVDTPAGVSELPATAETSVRMKAVRRSDAR
jgi:cellulose biosynthesis protein BcsQ